MKTATQSTQAPAGYSTVCPYLVVPSVETQLEFLETVLHAEIKDSFRVPEGEIMHAEARIGDTVIMIGRANEKWPARPGSLYIFVDDVDEIYQRALQHGAQSMMEPDNQFYGHREAFVADQHGNQWFFAKQVEEVSPEEMQRRLEQMTRKQ